MIMPQRDDLASYAWLRWPAPLCTVVAPGAIVAHGSMLATLPRLVPEEVSGVLLEDGGHHSSRQCTGLHSRQSLNSATRSGEAGIRNFSVCPSVVL